MSTYIQIGTNNGHDDFLKRVIHDKPDLVILVEPNDTWREVIRNNYKYVQSAVVIKSVAITDKSGDVVKLYIPKVEANGLAKNGYGYNSGNFSLLPMDDWGENLVSIEAPTLTFDDLCNEFGITEIEYLQLDTEGYDAQIIKMIDFNKYKIRELEYEYWGFSTDCFTRHGEAGAYYGIKGMQEAEKKLTDLGYIIKKSEQDTLNRVAKKK